MPSLSGSNGAIHVIRDDTQLFLGSRVDSEPEAIPTFLADGDTFVVIG